jgi:alkylation response protein AidB-like acyl-CoA dehydrogenase
MTHLLAGLVAATLLGVGSVLVFGPGSQLQHAWIEPLFWTLIVSGAMMSLFERGHRKDALPTTRAEQGV